MAADFQLLNSLRTTLAQTPELRETRPCIALRTAPFLQRHLIQSVRNVWGDEWNKQSIKNSVSHNRVNHRRQNWILALPGTCVLPATWI